jgi:hypothetical protein
MSLNADLHSHSFERGIISDKLAEYYDERLDIVDAVIDVKHRDMNRFEATVTYTDKRMGTVRAHYVVVLHDGWRVEFL